MYFFFFFPVQNVFNLSYTVRVLFIYIFPLTFLLIHFLFLLWWLASTVRKLKQYPRNRAVLDVNKLYIEKLFGEWCNDTFTWEWNPGTPEAKFLDFGIYNKYIPAPKIYKLSNALQERGNRNDWKVQLGPGKHTAKTWFALEKYVERKLAKLLKTTFTYRSSS